MQNSELRAGVRSSRDPYERGGPDACLLQKRNFTLSLLASACLSA